MKILFLISILFTFSNCSSNSILDNSTLNQPNNLPVAVLDSTILERNIDTTSAIKFGKALIANQVTISRSETEVYAHDSKLVILNGIGYCAYYGNDTKSAESAIGQSVRLSVFDINNPSKRKVFDAFKENYTYPTLKTDLNQPCYTPVLFITDDNKIRLLCKVYVKNVQKYYYRDFSPETETFSDPQICKILAPASVNSVDFDMDNVRTHLKHLFGNDFKLNTDFMFATSDPVLTKKGAFLGLTVGRFTVDWKTDEGVTLILKTNDFGKSFECVSAPDSRKINSKFNKHFVEGAFDFIDENEVIMIGRNSIGGILKSDSFDGGINFSAPISLNDNCKFNTLGSKPQFMKINDGILSMWNTTENYGEYNYRTVLEIRYGKSNNICGNNTKILIKNLYGCHYPSLFKYENKYYLTYTTDSRRFNRSSTGEIVFVKLPF